MKIKLNMNNGRATFFQIQDRTTRAHLCKNNFYPEIIVSDYGAVTMIFLYDVNRTNN